MSEMQYNNYLHVVFIVHNSGMFTKQNTDNRQKPFGLSEKTFGMYMTLTCDLKINRGRLFTKDSLCKNMKVM